MRSLLLIRHAPTAASRTGAFPLDEPLDERARSRAAGLAAVLPGYAEALTCPSRRCRETAQAAGLEARVEPALRECDFGSWAGRTLEDVLAAEPEAAAAWRADPDARGHGGESLRAFAARVGGWLDAQVGLDGRAIAITHGGVVRAAVVHAAGAPLEAFWRIDVAPLALTELHARDGRWTIRRVNCADRRAR